MDIGDTIAPDSDQLDAIDLRSSGPQTFTVTRVDVKRGDQPVDVYLREFPRPWRPGKSMRRVLDDLWGASAGGAYEGRKVTLFCDERVKFGGEAIGGVRISHMSHIGDKEQGVPLIVSRGNVKTYKVKPLTDAAPTNRLAEIKAAMERAGLSPGDLLTRASELTGRIVGHPGELTDTETDALIGSLTAEV